MAPAHGAIPPRRPGARVALAAAGADRRNHRDVRAVLGGIDARSHTIRLLHLLRLTLAEFEQASRAVVDDVFAAEADTTHAHEELFERGAPLVGLVHLRVEAFQALARLLCERLDLDPLPELALDRDFHVRLADDRRAMTATVWADSGDAELAPGTKPGSVSLHELLSRLEAYTRA